MLSPPLHVDAEGRTDYRNAMRGLRLGGGNFFAASDQGAIRHDNPRKAAAPVLALVYSTDVVLLLCAGVILWALILLPRSLIDPWLD